MINKKRSLRTHMLLSYVGIVIICMLVIPISISKLLDWQFKHFVENKLLEDRQEAVLFLEDIYSRGNSWNSELLSKLHGGFLHWPIIKATVYDKDGAFVKTFSKQSKRGRRRKLPLDARIENRETIKLVTFDEKLLVNGREVGRVSFTTMSFKDGPEAAFLNKFNKLLYAGVAFMLVIAVLIAFIMAERIIRPILNVIKRAYKISKGSYEMDDEINSNITEIQALIDSINRLGLGLETQELLRRRLMCDIAHELRNPVAIVKSHLEAFEDGVWEPTQQRIKLTVEEIDRLSKLISEVETLSVIEGENSGLVFSEVNFSNELEKCLLVFDPLFKNKSVTLLHDIEPNVKAIVDIQKIRQAIGNLLSNALHYTETGNRVMFSFKQNKNNIVFSVKDDGIGISENDLPNIFERFYRSDRSRSKASGGMGIGLAITKAIVEAHGGTINVESIDGKGSTFIVQIPLKKSIEDGELI